MIVLFNVEALLSTARERTGLSDFGPNDFMEGLTILVKGMNDEANIHPDRQKFASERILRLLINRLWFAKDLSEHPEIADEDLGAPIIIVSLPRTGTTKLQRLMSASGDFQTHTLWQEHMFARIPQEEGGGQAKRIQATRDYEKWLYETSPEILTGHPIFTDEADEDIWLLEFSFRHSMLFGIFDCPSYAQWVMQTDMRPAYNYLQLQLKYLQWQNRQRGKAIKPWLLKAPNHLGSETQLTRIFNKPRFVFSHRDPAKCIPSVVTIGVAMRKLYSDGDSSADIGAGISAMFLQLLNQHMQWRDDNPDMQICDLRFSDIASNGIVAAKHVYDYFELAFSSQSRRGMTNWEANNPREKHGKSHYSAAAMGTTDESIRRMFATYLAKFSNYL